MKSRGFKRIWGKPWDYAYLLLLEQRKLKEMAAYFKKSQLTVGWEFQVRDCELCVKLIDIILEKDKYYTSWLHNNYGSQVKWIKDGNGYKVDSRFPIHINIRNFSRFLPKVNLETVNQRTLLHLQVELRRMKAFYLYHKIRMYRMHHWWD